MLKICELKSKERGERKGERVRQKERKRERERAAASENGIPSEGERE